MISLTLDFDDKSGPEFIAAVKNCLEDSEKYPYVNYNDRSDNIIFTAQYLKNSLIKIPKN